MSASHHDPAPDFVRVMGPVARELLGEPIKATSSAREWRFGSNRGSLSVDLDKGTWVEHGGSGQGAHAHDNTGVGCMMMTMDQGKT